MPRTKKRKLNTDNAQTNGISHDEIWDDSALIRSWEDAYAEYQFYHSIHARGEDVDEVLRRAEAEDAGRKLDQIDDKLEESKAQAESMVVVDDESTGDIARNANGNETDDDVEEGELEDEETTTDAVQKTLNEGEAGVSEQIGPPLPPEAVARLAPKVQAVVPEQSVDANAMNQTLENIKMAYYWAGYYSGLYDGQQQGAANTTHTKGNS